VVRLKYNCEYCSYSEIQHFRKQIVGEPFGVGDPALLTVNYRCPRCGSTQWDVNQDFSLRERLYLSLYQSVADNLGKLGVKHWVFSKDQSVDDWIEAEYR
jgi:DNA-directed RNA polymerase subunit RPC12/RpoP